MPVSNPPFKCAICGKSVLLEQSKISEDGKPIHEECYVAQIKLQKKKRSQTS